MRPPRGARTHSAVHQLIRTILGRSLSLNEKQDCPDSAADAFPDADEARRLLALWERIVTRGQKPPEPFDAHLASLRLDRERALERLKGRLWPETAPWPAWAKLLEEALGLDRAATSEPAPAPHRGIDTASPPASALHAAPSADAPATPTLSKDGHPLFPEFLDRFVQVILARLHRKVRNLDAFVAPGALEDVARYALERLSALAARTVAFDLRTRAARRELRGDTAEARYRYWLSDVLGRSEGLGLWLSGYPVLARLLATVSLRVVTATTKLLQRVHRDHQALAARFGSAGELGPLTSLGLGLSDPHSQGQTVCELTFASGDKVVYKPRSLAVDSGFGGWLAWWNRQRPDLLLCIPKLLPRRQYGWYEWLSRRDCDDLGQVRRYYRRQGVYLAFFYLLGGTDFHHENFIPCGEWPIPIDLEGVLALGIFDPYPPVGPSPPCLQPLSTSVLSTLMLPAWRGGPYNQPLAYASGINGGGGRVPPRPRPAWLDPGTDRLRLTWESRVPDTRASQPRWRGLPVDAAAYLNDVIEGFQSAYRTLHQERSFLRSMRSPLRAFRTVPTRRALRDTRQYHDLLFWSTSPDLLTSGTARDLAFERLQEDPVGPPFETTSFVEEEKRSLREADIPIFLGRPDSPHLRSSSGVRFGPFPLQTPWRLMQARLEGLAQDDLDWQVQLIRGSFGLTFETTQALSRSEPAPSSKQDAPSPQGRLLRDAVALGEVLERLALRDHRGCRWLSLRRHPDYASQVFYCLSDPWLYAGTSGTGLFLANLAEATGDDRFAELAQSALGYAAWQHRHWVDHPWGDPPALSGYVGHGSLIYAFGEAARLLRDSRWLEEACRVRTCVTRERIAQELNPDVVGGLAGLLWALLHLYRVAPTPDLLADLHAVGQRLVALQGPGEAAGWVAPHGGQALLGMGHGAAGIANALARLHALTGVEVYRQAARRGWRFERAHFSAEHGDWPDLRSSGQEFMTGWCAGAAGAGLARLSLGSDWPEDQELAAEVDQAVAAALRRLGTDLHHLCCGECGRLLFLWKASRQLHRPALAARVIEGALQLAEFYQTQGYWHMQSCSERAILPELMGGIAGIGLTFLTLASPESRSRVLTLE